MILALLEALFLDGLCKVFRVQRTPTLRALDHERVARDEALSLATHDMQVELFEHVHPTFGRHHAAARTRHGLTA
jgi:hypothetical protein